ncbi:MAG: hypothetical protein ACK4GO_02545 [Gemmobacter sp.]
MPKLLIALLLLAACGADGPPEAPAPTKDGITVSGQARAGVVYRK